MIKEIKITQENLNDIENLVNNTDYSLVTVDIGNNTAVFTGNRHDYKLVSGTSIIQNANNISVMEQSKLVSIRNNRTIIGYANSCSYLFANSSGVFLENSKAVLNQSSKGSFRGYSRGTLCRARGVFKENSTCEFSRESSLQISGNSEVLKLENSDVECDDYSRILDSNNSNILVNGEGCNIRVDNNNRILVRKCIGQLSGITPGKLVVDGEKNEYSSKFDPAEFPVQVLHEDNQNSKYLEHTYFFERFLKRVIDNGKY